MDTQMNYYAALGEAEEKVSGSRKNLLMMIILTVVNLVLLALDSNAMMLFSATVPYYSVAIAMAMGIKELFIVAMIISVIIMILYLLCWKFSEKHYGWMIAALVFFTIDTLCLIGLYIALGEVSGILDFIIHIEVIYYIIIGIKYGRRLNQLKKQAPQNNEMNLDNIYSSNNSTDY